MLNLRNTKTLVAVTLVLLVAVTSAQAASWSGSGATGSATRSVALPLGPQSITQSTDPNTIEATAVACAAAGITTENAYYRLFDLDADHGLVGDFCADNVDYAIETATDNGVPQTIDINISCLDDGFPFLNAFLTPAGSTSTAQPDADLEFFNVPATGCCDSAAQAMAVQIAAPVDCTLAGCNQLYVGANSLGQSAPTFLESASCGIVDPTDTGAIGFPDMHLIMVVNDGPTGGDDGGDDVVPASNGIGIVLMLVLLLGSSAYFMRRRVMN